MFPHLSNVIRPIDEVDVVAKNFQPMGRSSADKLPTKMAAVSNQTDTGSEQPGLT